MNSIYILNPGEKLQVLDEDFQPVGEPLVLTEELTVTLLDLVDGDTGDLVRLADGRLAQTC